MKAFLRPALALTLILATACGGEPAEPSVFTRMGRAVGLADEPPPPTITVDVACDASKGSTCTAESLDATLVQVIRVTADRPGSEVRLWMVGPTLATTKLIASVTSDVPRNGNAKSKRAAAARYIESARAYLTKAAQPYLDEPERGGSPLSEALTLIALAGARTDHRLLCLVSDGLEVSKIGGDLECADPLPTPSTFVKTLQREHVLPAGSLTDVKVLFMFMTITATDRRGCAAMSLERRALMEELWTSAIAAAGGTAQFDTGATDLTTITTTSPEGDE